VAKLVMVNKLIAEKDLYLNEHDLYKEEDNDDAVIVFK